MDHDYAFTCQNLQADPPRFHSHGVQGYGSIAASDATRTEAGVVANFYLAAWGVFCISGWSAAVDRTG